MSVSCINVLSTFQEDRDSPGQRVSPPCSAPPIGLHSEGKTQSSHGGQEPDLQHHEEPSDDLSIEPKRSSCSEEAKSLSEDVKTESVGESRSVNLFSADDSEGSSRFVSAAGGLEWLIEALKEKCLTEHCTVQLDRLDILTVSQLCSESTYSSCLGDSSSAHSRETDEHPPSVDSGETVDLSRSPEPSFHLHLSAENIQNSDYLQSGISLEFSEHAAAVTLSDSQSAGRSSTQESMEQSASVHCVESTRITDSSVEFIMDTQLSLTKQCTVQLKRMDLSQELLDANKSENDKTCDSEEPEDLTCAGETTERTMASVRQSNSSSVVAQTAEEKAAVLTEILKEECLPDKLIVEIKRVTLSQLKEILQLRDATLKSPTNVSDSASGDQTKNEHNANHCNEETSAMEVNMKKRRSTRSAAGSDKEEVVKNKRKKTSLAPKEKKRRSASTDRPGTTRKVCVSGLSVSRWTNKGSANTHMFRGRTGPNKAADCSINELMSGHHKQPRVRTICTQTQDSTAEILGLF